MDLMRLFFILFLSVVGVICDDTPQPPDSGFVVDPCNRTNPCVPNTLVADPNDCSMYWQCLDFGQWVNRTCVDDYSQFDSLLRRCVRAGNATCQAPCKLYCKRPKTCIIGARVPDPFNCGRYYLCEYGSPRTWRKMFCPDGTKFDMTFMVCVTDHPAVSCHPPCDVDPCDGIPRKCPMKGIRMAFPNYPSAYYECTENDGQWNIVYCDVGKKFDYKTKNCSYNGVPHPGCGSISTTAEATTTDETSMGTTPGHTHPEILDHTLVRVTQDVLEGKMVNFTCRVELSESMFGNSLTWYYENVKISGGGGSKFRTTMVESGATVVGSFTINPLTSSDSGTVQCEFSSVGGLDSTKTLYFAVLVKPTVILSNMTATVTIGDELDVTCTGDVMDTGAPGVEDFVIEWFKNGAKLTSNGDERISEDSPTRSRLKLSNIQESNSYGCQAGNKAGPSQRLQCDVTAVPKETPKCPSEKAHDVLWPRTAVGKTSRELCPGNATGTATRHCMHAGEAAEWDEANLNNCVDPKFQKVMNQISDLKSGLGADSPEIVTSVAESLAKQTNVSNSGEGEPIKPGNLNVSVSAITDLADLHEMENAAAATPSEVESVVTAASNLLSSDNAKSWLSILKDDSGRAVKIMNSIDKYTSYVAKMLPTATEGRLGFEAANVVLTSETWEDGNLTFPNTSAEWVQEETSDFIVISNDTLFEIASAMGEKRLVVSNTYYSTLDVMLPTNKSEDVPANASLVSRILSITIDELPDGFTFETPIEMEFGNREVLKPRDTRICGFWNYSSGDSNNSGQWSSSGCRMVFTDDNVTSCECDHMTNFAILVSRFRPSGDHMTVLSTLTVIGLSLSIVCLITTIVMYVMLWKFIKSDYALMLVNLCIALALANLIFLGGINQTEPRVLCGVVAVLLHYLFLVAFFLMLAESVELLLYIVFVFHIHTMKETAGLLIAAWGTPVIIVTICLGVTNGEGYGNEDFCWLSLEKGLIWAFLGPIIVIIVINLFILAIVIRKINDSARLRDEKRSNRMRSATWNMLVLAPLLGISWTFGLFSFNEATIAFQYIFTALNAFQGLFIFVFHCLFNKRLRDAFTEKFAVDTSSNLNSSTGGKATSEQQTRSRKASSTMSASKFVAADTQPAAATGYKVTRSDTQSTYDNPGFHLIADVSSDSPDRSQNRRYTPATGLSLEKPDIVQTLPKEMHTPRETSDQVSNLEMATYMTDSHRAGSGSGNQADTKGISSKDGVVKVGDQDALSNIRLRHDYTSYRV